LIIHRVLAATDGTEASLRGVVVAAQLVATIHAEFVLLTAVSVPQHMVLTANMDERSIHQYLERTAQEALAPALDLLRREGVGAEVKLVYGPPPETILTEVETSRADLVVMGRGSRTEPKDFLLGSVSDRVARNVKVPILLVP
jgi:nucleotide-binding universal stress UspA family protein